MVISGTPNQFFSLFNSTQDGLFSRFLTYCYQLKEIRLENAFVRTNDDYFDSFEEESKSFVYGLYHSLANLNYEIEFKWKKDQAERLFNHFNKLLSNVNPMFGDSSIAVVLRHMLVATRLGMVLTTIEKYENGELKESKEIFPADHVVDGVIKIIETCSQHSLLLMANIEANSKHRKMDMKSHKMLQFFNALPEMKKFKTKEAIEIGKKMGISQRSVGDYLPSLCKSKHLEQTAFGEYRRINQ